MILTHRRYKNNLSTEELKRFADICVKDKDTKETWSQASRNQVRGGLLGQSTDAKTKYCFMKVLQSSEGQSTALTEDKDQSAA